MLDIEIKQNTNEEEVYNLYLQNMLGGTIEDLTTLIQTEFKVVPMDEKKW